MSDDARGTVIQPFRVLMICTGNICRSPMAQVMLTHRLRERLGRDTADRYFEVSSAGTYGLEGHPIESYAADVLAGLGIEPDRFAARALIASYVEAADLILGATREHRAAAVTLVPRASSRTFTMREFARLARAAAVKSAEGAEPPDRARRLVHAAAAQRGLVRAHHPDDDDVADPYRRPVEAFDRAGREIRAAVDAISDAVAAACS